MKSWRESETSSDEPDEPQPTTAPTPTPLEALEREWSIFPAGLNKKPIISEWKPFQTRKPTKAEVSEWEQLNPATWALVTGAISGEIILDYDGEKGRQLLEKHGLKPHRRTPSGGYHVHFIHPGWRVPTLNSKTKHELGKRWPGLDIRADGGYAIFAGHTDGGDYECLREPTPYPLEILPDDLREFLGLLHPPVAAEPRVSRPATSSNGRFDSERLIRMALGRAPVEGRNNMGFWLAAQSRDNGYSELETESIMRDYAGRCSMVNTKGQPEPYDQAELRATIREVFKQAPRGPWTQKPQTQGTSAKRTEKKPLPADSGPRSNGQTQASEDPKPSDAHTSELLIIQSDLTEELLAQMFEARWGGVICFDCQQNAWFFWNETEGRWKKDETHIAFYYAREICRQSNIAGLKTFAKASTYAGVERICQASPVFAVTSKIWDTDPWLLGVPGGVVDLRIGQPRPARKEDRITKQTAVAPDWQMPCPVFRKFLNEITKQNRELEIYLQRIAGYALTGSVREQKLFFIYGVGKNGKTLFINTISGAMGDYAVDAAMDTFVRRQGERHPTDIASLRGARLVSAIETEEGRRWDEALIKKLTGGDPVTARFMRQDFFTYLPQFTLIIAGNHAPLLSNVGEGIRRRFQIIPFEFKADPVDDQLENKLRQEWPAILAWAIDGARDWNEYGLTLPEVVARETEEYFAGQDQIQGWLTECCLAGPNHRDQSSVIFNSWKAWAKDKGALEEAPSMKRLTALLKDRRLVRARHERTGTILWGIAVKVEYKPDPRTGERDED